MPCLNIHADPVLMHWLAGALLLVYRLVSCPDPAQCVGQCQVWPDTQVLAGGAVCATAAGHAGDECAAACTGQAKVLYKAQGGRVLRCGWVVCCKGCFSSCWYLEQQEYAVHLDICAQKWFVGWVLLA